MDESADWAATAFVTAPGLMYVFIERYIFGGNVGVMGAR